ncbi:MAG TPA: PHP domain-containing protein, partial [Bdellovibrio sp.]|nr:PHP domain-containing protein [Bdellovibrio sp.]
MATSTKNPIRHSGLYYGGGNSSSVPLNGLVTRPSSKDCLPAAPPLRAKGYVELLARSNFSFLRGASHPEEMVEQAIKYEYDGIALCDLNGLYGVARGYATAHSPTMFAAAVKAKESFHYLIGSELTLTDESVVTLIPQNKQGYSHLCELLTLGKRQAAKGFSALHWKQIETYSQDLLCLALPPISEERFESLEKVFGDRLYIPVWRDLTWESQEFCKQAFFLEEKYGAQLFVTQRAFMHTPERKSLFDVLTCILHHTTLEEARDRLIQNAERSLKSLEEICERWRDRLDLVEKTVEIAARSKFSLSEIRYRYPHSNIPDNLTPAEYLRQLTTEGARWRFPEGVSEKIQNQIEKELNLISTLQYEDY